MVYIEASTECSHSYQGLCMVLQYNQLNMLSSKEAFYRFAVACSNWEVPDTQGENSELNASIHSMLSQILHHIRNTNESLWQWYQHMVMTKSVTDRDNAMKVMATFNIPK